MNEVVIPKVVASERKSVSDFMDVVSSSLRQFETEWKFYKELKNADLIRPVQQCAIFNDQFAESNNLEDPESETLSNEGKSSILMPLGFQITKFLELPGVLQKIMDNTRSIQQSGKLNHFINGSLWKEKIKHFGKTVIPFHLYSDGAQLNHQLGPHVREGSEDFHYYSFPTVPTQFQSRLENIFLCNLFPGTLS